MSDLLKKLLKIRNISNVNGIIREQNDHSMEIRGYNINLDPDHKMVNTPKLPKDLELLSDICDEMDAHSFSFISEDNKQYRYYKSTNNIEEL